MTDKEIRILINPREFVNAWFRMLPHYPTYNAAYEALEDIYEDYFGRRKYSSYKSFEVIKNRIYQSDKK